MFNYKEYRKFDWKDKIEYVAQTINLPIADVAYIIELDPSELLSPSISEYFNEYPESKSFENFYLLNIIFNYLVTVGEYDSYKIKEIWQRKSIYVNLISKPPWFQDSLRKYLLNNRVQGLIKCIDWIRRN